MCSLQDHQGRLRIFQAHCGNLFSISFCGISVCSLTSAGSTASGSHHVKFPFRFATKILIVFDNLSGVFCRRLLRRGRATESGRAQGKREGPCVPWSNSAAPPQIQSFFLKCCFSVYHMPLVTSQILRWLILHVLYGTLFTFEECFTRILSVPFQRFFPTKLAS